MDQCRDDCDITVVHVIRLDSILSPKICNNDSKLYLISPEYSHSFCINSWLQ